MPLIDQRILIAASAETIWTYLTRPEHVTRWHLGCKQLSILTTRAQGVGVRRRCTDERGRSTVEEITAWLENIGYEYKIVDGPYRAFRARFRLQPAPEGTLVNWVVEYRRRGIFSGLRELLGERRRTENLMAESLRNLRKLVERSGARLDPERQARVAMRPAPDAAARAARGAQVTRAQAVSTPPRAPIVIGDDDLPEPAMPTRIHQPVTEPSFVTKLSAAEHAPADPAADTKPRKPKGLAEALQATTVHRDTTHKDTARKDEPTWDAAARTVPISLVAPKPPPAGPTQALESTPPRPHTLPEVPPTPPQGSPLPKPSARERDTKPKPTTLYDTGEVSIWEVFGIPRPSEQMRTDLHEIVASLIAPSAPEPPVAHRNALWRKRRVPVRPSPSVASAGRARLAARSRVRARPLTPHDS
ncbi:MAG: SRPBCC family protein [Chloroflexi bacterium]|nr:SRPBCC family protein [Chloroflexota bacterium]